jgi:hypothetical protein
VVIPNQQPQAALLLVRAGAQVEVFAHLVGVALFLAVVAVLGATLGQVVLDIATQVPHSKGLLALVVEAVAVLVTTVRALF